MWGATRVLSFFYIFFFSTRIIHTRWETENRSQFWRFTFFFFLFTLKRSVAVRTTVDKTAISGRRGRREGQSTCIHNKDVQVVFWTGVGGRGVTRVQPHLHEKHARILVLLVLASLAAIHLSYTRGTYWTVFCPCSFYARIHSIWPNVYIYSGLRE